MKGIRGRNDAGVSASIIADWPQVHPRFSCFAAIDPKASPTPAPKTPRSSGLCHHACTGSDCENSGGKQPSGRLQKILLDVSRHTATFTPRPYEVVEAAKTTISCDSMQMDLPSAFRVFLGLPTG